MAATDRAIRVGGVMPLSRPGFLEAGRHLKAGLELAVADANGLGGIGGRPLELLVRDTGAGPAMRKGEYAEKIVASPIEPCREAVLARSDHLPGELRPWHSMQREIVVIEMQLRR